MSNFKKILNTLNENEPQWDGAKKYPGNKWPSEKQISGGYSHSQIGWLIQDLTEWLRDNKDDKEATKLLKYASQIYNEKGKKTL